VHLPQLSLECCSAANGRNTLFRKSVFCANRLRRHHPLARRPRTTISWLNLPDEKSIQNDALSISRAPPARGKLYECRQTRPARWPIRGAAQPSRDAWSATRPPPQPRDAANPSHASTPATTQATQLAHTGIAVPPTVIGQPAKARASCSRATAAKIALARRE
jgi:hypothetical protein